MAKKVVALIKLALQAGKANPAPPVGPALGQHGVNIMAFCKEYNSRTQDKAGFVIPVEISVFEDRSFTFITKTPPASVLITKAAGIEKGSGESAKGSAGSITKSQLEEIEPALPFADSPDPFSIPAAFVIKTEAGGVFVMKVKLRSSKTDISTGMTKPALS